ncbi:hypothetical protein ES702_03915 [subsurface metagenome]
MILDNNLENWENTLDQLDKNYLRACQKMGKQLNNLKHMENTIRVIEEHIQKLVEKSLKEKAMRLQKEI